MTGKEEFKETEKSKTNRIDGLNKEKAVIVYLSLAERYKEHRDKITCSVFINTWGKMFKCDKYINSKDCGRRIHDIQVAAFAFVKDELDGLSLEEIKAYRDTVLVYPTREVPYELKKLAQTKKVVITLAENHYKHLSGFDVMVVEGKCRSYKINKIPYGLSENGARRLLESLPTREELIKKEKNLMTTIQSNSIPVAHKKKAVSRYRQPYATHDFKKFMNRFTIYDCENKELTLFCVNLCNRVGINNLSNELPIKYEFCVGSGKRKSSMKKVKNRKKGNAKAAKKRKGN